MEKWSPLAEFLVPKEGGFKIDLLIEDNQKKIALLEEHRSALISNLVTGKIRVVKHCPKCGFYCHIFQVCFHILYRLHNTLFYLYPSTSSNFFDFFSSSVTEILSTVLFFSNRVPITE